MLDSDVQNYLFYVSGGTMFCSNLLNFCFTVALTQYQQRQSVHFMYFNILSSEMYQSIYSINIYFHDRAHVFCLVCKQQQKLSQVKKQQKDGMIIIYFSFLSDQTIQENYCICTPAPNTSCLSVLTTHISYGEFSDMYECRNKS